MTGPEDDRPIMTTADYVPVTADDLADAPDLAALSDRVIPRDNGRQTEHRKARVHWCNPGMWAWQVPDEPGTVLVGIDHTWRQAFDTAWWAMYWRHRPPSTPTERSSTTCLGEEP